MNAPVVLSGLFPRREDFVKATWDSDKGLLGPDRLDAARLDDVRALVTLQERLGFAAATDGNLSWQDAFRGVVENHPAFEANGLVRLFETNKFYRQPVLKATPTPRPQTLEPHFLLERVRTRLPKKAILPSPYWFARAAHRPTGQPVAQAGEVVARYLNGVARWLEKEGYAHVQFNDPLLFYEREPDLQLAAALYETVLAGLHATTIVNFPNGNAARHLAWAAALPARFVGIDFVETHIEDLKAPKARLRLLAAVVDSQESLVESEAHLRRLVDAIEKRLRPDELHLTHTWDLEFLPTRVAVQKLELLSRVVAREVTA